MVILIQAALTTNVEPYAVAVGVGFVIGITGHVIKSRTLILAGILIVGLAASLFAFGAGKLT